MWDDLQIEDNGMRLRLRKSKTDQAGQGTWVAFAPASREELCPIAAMRSYLKSRGSQPGFLFQHANGSPLTKYQFWAVASKALQALGLGECQFGTHSFRIGAASTAAAAGMVRHGLSPSGDGDLGPLSPTYVKQVIRLSLVKSYFVFQRVRGGVTRVRL